jgi:hypothetical protein
MTLRCEFAAQVMGADAGFHANQARWYIGQPRFYLATRPLLPQYDGATRIVAYDMERVLAISMPITAIAVLDIWDMACSLSLGPPFGSFACW